MPSLRALALSVPKPVVAVVLPTAVVAVTGVAVSYWTADGTGSGTAATATGTAALTVTQAGALTDLGPGRPASPIAVDVANNGAESVRVAQLVAKIDSVTPVGTGVCSTADYALSNATMTTTTPSLAPAATVTFSGASLTFVDAPDRNQDGCKGAKVTLSYLVS